MTILVVFVALAILVSFYCSLLESAFLSITPAFVQVYQKKNPKEGVKLAQLKHEVDRPLAAILSLNTIAHTLGGTGAGAQAASLFGNQWIALFSALLTLAILILSEVIPNPGRGSLASLDRLRCKNLARPDSYYLSIGLDFGWNKFITSTS